MLFAELLLRFNTDFIRSIFVATFPFPLSIDLIFVSSFDTIALFAAFHIFEPTVLEVLLFPLGGVGAGGAGTGAGAGVVLFPLGGAGMVLFLLGGAGAGMVLFPLGGAGFGGRGGGFGFGVTAFRMNRLADSVNCPGFILLK